MEELNNLIESFRSANQSLRKRAIALGVLMILAIALRYSENVRFTKVSNLVDYQYGLEQIAVLPDSTFRAVIDGDWELEKKYFYAYGQNGEELTRYRLFETVKLNDYDRKLVKEAITEIDQRIESYNEQQSIGILGLAIPLEPVAYLSLVFVLVLFHDFTQIIIVRNQIYRRIRGQNLFEWKLGVEFFGFYNPDNNSTLKFMRFTSSIITGVLITCPLVTSFLMMSINNSNSLFLFLLNIVCFLLIVIDTMIIFHTENIAGARYFANFYLGRHNTSKFKMRFVWGFPLALILSINLGVGMLFIEEFGLSGIVYCLMSLVPPIPLFFALVLTQKNPTKRNRAIRTGLLLLNVFWILVTVFVLSTIHKLTGHKIDKLGEVLVVAIFLCALYAFIYMKFFMDGKRTKRKRIRK